MSAKFTNKRPAEDYESDDGFVEDGRSSKKSKANKGVGNAAMQTDDEGNPFWEISGKRRLQVSEFKGTTMIGIREYYEKDGKMLPGKKGITMTLDQYSSFVALLPEVERVLKEKGKSVPRPQYGQEDITGGGGHQDDDGDGGEEQYEANPSKPGRSKHRANYEGTSDEDEG